MSYRECLLNLAQFYFFTSSAQGLCKPWGCQHKHTITMFLRGFFSLLFAFSKLFFITCNEQVCWVKASEGIKYQNYSYYAIWVCCHLLSCAWRYTPEHASVIESSCFQSGHRLIYCKKGWCFGVWLGLDRGCVHTGKHILSKKNQKASAASRVWACETRVSEMSHLCSWCEDQ